MSKVLLVGNDINNVKPGYSWENLLEGLIQFVGARGKIRPISDQFPLFYEEIYSYARRENTKSEREIKEFIADKVSKISGDSIHQRLIALPVENYLTTNYDFSLENSAGSMGPIKNSGVVDETRYSLFRRMKCGSKSIWHIHGDRDRPGTICLGYEQYSGYLQAMRNYVVSGVAYKDYSEDALIKRWDALDYDCWIDHFLKSDVYILGLRLDFVEMHLWWLLAFWSRRGREGGKSVTFENKIVYYVPERYWSTSDVKQRFLRAFNVDIRKKSEGKGARKKVGYYERVIDDIGSD